MITSALINQCRREVKDWPKSTRAIKLANGVANVFSVPDFPIIESSYSVYRNSTLAATSAYTPDLDNGEFVFTAVPSAGVEVKIDHKFAHWRDANWNEAINQGVNALIARGFYRMTERDTSSFKLSANIQNYNGPTNCIDVYGILVSDNYGISGNYIRPSQNWEYNSITNKIIWGAKPDRANFASISYAKKMSTYSATSATLDIDDKWIELVKYRAQANYYRSLAAKIAQQGSATIDEGHFSFSNLRALAADLDNKFEVESLRMKPVSPAKEIKNNIPGGGTIR